MTWDAALDLVLGSACAACGLPGRALCLACEGALPREGWLAMPTPTPPGLLPVFAAGEYDAALKSLVIAHKERGRIALARPLGNLLAAVVADLVPCGPVLLVPVPSSRPVVRARGHDPLLRISLAAASSLRADGRPAQVRRLLRSVRKPQDQAGLGHVARSENLRGAFRAVGPPDSGPVVVVDDVVTTGATVREAQRALEDVGTLVTGIAALAATRRRSLPIHARDD